MHGSPTIKSNISSMAINVSKKYEAGTILVTFNSEVT